MPFARCLHRSSRLPTVTIGAACLAAMALTAPSAGAQNFVAVVSPDIQSHVSFSTGAAWVDYDGDGDLDLFVATAFGADKNNVLYRNDGADTFVRVTNVPLGLDAAQTVCSTWADYDNDGAIDAYVSGLDTDHGLLYHGAAGGAMIENSSTVLSAATVKGAGCAWGDYDNDGHVDLVVSVIAGALGMTGGNRLFHNRGDGGFDEITGVPPTSVIDTHHHPTWVDFDGDGDLDLCFATGAVGSLGPDPFYRNELVETGSATFTPITSGLPFSDSRDSQALSWADYDNDGDLDCYAINYTTVGNQLYRNDGATFTKITTGAIVTDKGAAHGVAWGDYDNDGDLDVVVARDNNQVDRYYRNEGDGTFTSVTTGPVVTTARSQYAVAAADYDGDGDLDLFLPTARSEGPSVLYRNDLGSGAHWLEVTVVGVTANRSAIGARVRVLATLGGLPRWQLREIAASTGYGSEGMLAAHFGLADATIVDSLVIEWPGGGVDRFAGLVADRARTIVQGDGILGVDTRRAAQAVHALRVNPNPVTRRGELCFELPRSGPAEVSVHDLQGRLVARIAADRYAAGPQHLEFDASELPGGGVFFARVRTPDGAAVRRFVRLR